MKTYSRIYWCIATCFCLVVAFSCNKKVNDDKQIFRYNQIGGLESLDPAFAKNQAVMWVVHFIYNTLVEVDTQLNITPSIATSWQTSPDGLQYTFHLRQDVYFQDNALFAHGKGRKMVADDVVYSFNRLIDPVTASAGAWIFNDRVRDSIPFEALNDSTFVIHLKAPFRPMLQILTMQYCSIVPKEVVTHWGKDFRNHPCGTGAFQFHYWDEGNALILHRNNNYWEHDEQGNRLPYLDGIQVSFNETRAIEFLLFRQGKLDFVDDIDGSMKDIILTKKGTLQEHLKKEFNLAKKPYLNTEYIGILVDTNNAIVKNSPLRLQKVRQAINYGIDRQKIVTYFRNNVGKPANKGFTPISMPGMQNNNRKYGYEYNPTKALQLLKEAGIGINNPTLKIVLNTPEVYTDICNFIATQLNEIGLQVQVQVIQPSLLRQMMSRSQTGFFKAQWIADYPDAETYLAFFYSQFPAPPNYTQFSNKQFDNWYRESLVIDNDTLRYDLYSKMDSLVSSEAAVLPILYDEILHFTRKNINGFSSNALNIIELKKVKKGGL